MGKQSSAERQVDVTYVKRGQLAALTRLAPGARSERAKAAIARRAKARRAAR
ncbi:hypothetical protein ACQ856_05985 [Mycolicibacterium psychrotolerans]|uniref:hypothetical protein n=1 Tax=Mycolicibacterium psychrotolerans TaxID=216929 RepID=UPI003D678692